MGWTDQQIQSLKQMWGNGYSASDIAKNLGNGMTRNAVIGKAHRLKLSVGASAPSSRAASAPMPSKTGGSAIKAMTRVSKKTAMLRPLPSVQASVAEPVVQPRPVVREPLIVPSMDTLKKSEGISVTKAGERHCRWPIGDPRSPDFRFCGCKSVDGLPYCADHARVAYQSMSRKTRNNTGE